MSKLSWLLATIVAVASPATTYAQRGGGGATPADARDTAAVDLTGYWVSVITEDWKFRMFTPKKGVFDALPLTAQGRTVGNAWDPGRDEAAGEQCRAYGAAGLMRMPTRLHITWQDANTLRIDTDAGTQTRLFHFAPSRGRGVPSESREAAPPQPGERSWQGHSVSEWEYAPSGRGAARLGSLKVVTTNLRAGYVRRNGAPYSEQTILTEHYDVNTLPNGDRWMTITTKVEDSMYFTRPFITTSDFKKLPDATGWNPTACAAK